MGNGIQEVPLPPAPDPRWIGIGFPGKSTGMWESGAGEAMDNDSSGNSCFSSLFRLERSSSSCLAGRRIPGMSRIPGISWRSSTARGTLPGLSRAAAAPGWILGTERLEAAGNPGIVYAGKAPGAHGVQPCTSTGLSIPPGCPSSPARQLLQRWSFSRREFFPIFPTFPNIPLSLPWRSPAPPPLSLRALRQQSRVAWAAPPPHSWFPSLVID